jgi:Mor family transcriptional regulator
MGRKGRGGEAAELIKLLVELGTRTLVEQCSFPEQQAREAMREIAHNLARNYGGNFMYVPKDSEFALTKRDLVIYERMTSGNANELSREFKLSVQQIYSINRYVREKLLRDRQARLPGIEDSGPGIEPAEA